MREILFRGKRIDSGEWVTGNLFYENDGTYETTKIIHDARFQKNGTELSFEHVKADPATIGQYTGLTDKSGVKIFEGDLLRDEVGKGEVFWFSEYCAFAVKSHDDECYAYHFFECDVQLKKSEVIGNIHDAPGGGE